MHFEKEDQLHSLNISEIIDSEKYRFLNVRKLPFQNTFGESTCSQVTMTPEISTGELSF